MGLGKIFKKTLMPWKDDNLKKILVPPLAIKPKDLSILNPKYALNPIAAFKDMKNVLPHVLAQSPLLFIPNKKKPEGYQEGDVIPIELSVATTTNPNGEITYYIVPANYHAKDVVDTGGDATKFEITHGSYRGFRRVVDGESIYWELKVMPEAGYTGDMEVTIKDTAFHLNGRPFVKNLVWTGTRKVESKFPIDVSLLSGSYVDNHTISYTLRIDVPNKVILTDTEVAASNFTTSGELKSVTVRDNAVHLVIEESSKEALELTVVEGFLHSTDNRTNMGTSLAIEPRTATGEDGSGYVTVIDTQPYRTRIKTGICCPCSPTPIVGVLNKLFSRFLVKDFTNSCDLKWVFGNSKGELTVKQDGLYQINIASNGANVQQGFDLVDGTNTGVILASAGDVISYHIGETTHIVYKDFVLKSAKPAQPADYSGGVTVRYLGDIKNAPDAKLLTRDAANDILNQKSGATWLNLVYPSGEKVFDLFTNVLPAVVTPEGDWTHTPVNREQWYYTEVTVPKDGDYIISCFGDDTASLLIDGAPVLWGQSLNRNTQTAGGQITLAGGQFTKHLEKGKHLFFGYNKNTVDNSLQYFCLSVRDAQTKEEFADGLTYKLMDLPLNCENQVTTPKLWSDAGNKVFNLGGDKVISNMTVNKEPATTRPIFNRRVR